MVADLAARVDALRYKTAEYWRPVCLPSLACLEVGLLDKRRHTACKLRHYAGGIGSTWHSFELLCEFLLRRWLLASADGLFALLLLVLGTSATSRGKSVERSLIVICSNRQQLASGNGLCNVERQIRRFGCGCRICSKAPKVRAGG